MDLLNDEDKKHFVAAIIRDDSNKILLMYHIKSGLWTIPMAEIHPDQDPYIALIKVIKRDCNIQVVEFDKLMAKKFTDRSKGPDIETLSTVFEVLEWKGEPRLMQPNTYRMMKFGSEEDILELTKTSPSTALLQEYLRSL